MKPNLTATQDVQWLWYVYGVAEVSTLIGAKPPALMSPVTVECAWAVPWWFRLWTRILLRSRWERPSVDFIIEKRQAIMNSAQRAEPLKPVPPTIIDPEWRPFNKEESGP